MRGAESIIDIDFCQTGKRFGKIGPFFSSSAWKRRFSSKSTSPLFKALAAASASGPIQSRVVATGFPSNSDNLLATGVKTEFVFWSPFRSAQMGTKDNLGLMVN